MRVAFAVNGDDHELELEPRELLVDVLRDHLGLTGVHAACDQGACGSCTVLVDGSGVRSCLMFGVQLAGHHVTTIEGVGSPGDLHPIQRALSEHHGLQCGYCTPGIVLTALELLRDTPEPTAEEIDAGMSGSLCRCTGYTPIVDAIAAVAASGRSDQ
jgi:carbon-monoxide dehydrogenase small subunit